MTKNICRSPSGVHVAKCCRLANTSYLAEAVDSLIEINVYKAFLSKFLQDLSLLYLMRLNQLFDDSSSLPRNAS